MAIVSKPESGNKATLYDIPDSDLERYKIPGDKLAQMFPKKENWSRDDAVIRIPVSKGGEVTAYNAPEQCCGWVCWTTEGLPLGMLGVLIAHEGRGSKLPKVSFPPLAFITGHLMSKGSL